MCLLSPPIGRARHQFLQATGLRVLMVILMMAMTGTAWASSSAVDALATGGACRIQTNSSDWSEFATRNAYTADGAVHKFSVCGGNKGPWAWESTGNITVEECAAQAKKLGGKCWCACCTSHFLQHFA